MPDDAAEAGRAGDGSGAGPCRRILIVTDAWAPQVNGVVRTLERLGVELERMGHAVAYATPQGMPSVPLPSYPEIRLGLTPGRRVRGLVRRFAPDAIHVATEGTLGLAARNYCVRRNIAFTTSFHTRFPEYISARWPIVPERLTYRALRWFHAPATAMMVATQSLKREMADRGFTNLRLWSRGVDTALYHPDRRGGRDAEGLARPIFLYVGRVAIEKNVEAFLKLDLPGSKLVIGDGPQRAELIRRYPQVRFPGPRFGEDLAKAYADADVFVFPSRTDTFGLVLLEALASGTPVAAYPVQGPRDVITDPRAGTLDEDLRAACLSALTLKRADARAHAERFSWHACAQQFLDNLSPEVEIPDEA